MQQRELVQDRARANGDPARQSCRSGTTACARSRTQCAATMLLLFRAACCESMELMRWEHVKWDQRVLHVAITKNNKPFDLPLTRHLLDLLAARRAENDRLHGSRCSRRTKVGYSRHGARQVHREEPREKIGRCTPRRSTICAERCVTVAESLDISQYALQALVNHRQPRGDVTAGYIKGTTWSGCARRCSK